MLFSNRGENIIMNHFKEIEIGFIHTSFFSYRVAKRSKHGRTIYNRYNSYINSFRFGSLNGTIFSIVKLISLLGIMKSYQKGCRNPFQMIHPGRKGESESLSWGKPIGRGREMVQAGGGINILPPNEWPHRGGSQR